MTQDGWLESTDAMAMLAFLRETRRLTDRKARLYAVAVCRLLWPLLSDARSRYAVEVAEAFADGRASYAELNYAYVAAFEHAEALVADGVRATGDAADAAVNVAYAEADHAAFYVTRVILSACSYSGGLIEGKALPTLVREIFGPRQVPIEPSLLTANGGLVAQLAGAAYEERILPEGRLDNARLAVLADALEEAGFEDEGILSHLRQLDAIHVRGCAVVDALLGLS